MILVDLLINFTGAIIGAGVASSAALWIAYKQRRDAAKDNLRALLMAQLNMTFAEIDIGTIPNPALIAQHNFGATYHNILAAYINYRDMLCSFERNHISEAWRAYKGTGKKCFDRFDRDFSSFRNVLSEEEFQNRTRRFLEEI
jgi:hypothetical protein